MLQGINLTLMIGPAIPIIAPKVVVEALTSVQVTNSKDNSGFQLVFTIGKDSPIVTTLLPSGYFDPISTRVIIIVTLNGTPNVLMDGLVTHHQFAPSNEAGKTTLTITGEDLSIAMDLIQNIIPLPMPDVAKIYLRLAPYAFLGVIPLVIPPPVQVITSPTEKTESQSKETDKQYLKNLASRNGYIFYVQAGPLPGQSIAYFGPDVNLPIPQKAITIDFDAHSNADSLSFSLDGTAKKIRIYTIFDPITKKIPIPVPVPNINILKPPLGARLTPPAKVEFDDDSAKSSVGKAARDILAFLMNNNAAAVSGNGSFDVLRYKSILRARMLVGVRGAGITYDGLYYVNSVTHNIKKGEYKQSFTLSRDGLISNTPFLPV